MRQAEQGRGPRGETQSPANHHSASHRSLELSTDQPPPTGLGLAHQLQHQLQHPVKVTRSARLLCFCRSLPNLPLAPSPCRGGLCIALCPSQWPWLRPPRSRTTTACAPPLPSPRSPCAPLPRPLPPLPVCSFLSVPPPIACTVFRVDVTVLPSLSTRIAPFFISLLVSVWFPIGLRFGSAFFSFGFVVACLRIQGLTF